MSEAELIELERALDKLGNDATIAAEVGECEDALDHLENRLNSLRRVLQGRASFQSSAGFRKLIEIVRKGQTR
jgi:hypothetical protein